MTHNELLAKMSDIHNDHSDPGELANKQYFGMLKFFYAAQAAVELHAPKEFEFNDQLVIVCGHCQLGVVGDEYPCETIQAIEKELA